MYWLGLAYIEGKVLNDYEQGVAWLKETARLGNIEAARMYEFMENAFSGGRLLRFIRTPLRMHMERNTALLQWHSELIHGKGAY